MKTKRVANCIGVSLCIVTVFALACTTVLNLSPASARDSSESECIASSGAGSVWSVQRACRACFSSGGNNKGAMWLTRPGERNASTIVVSANEATQGKIDLVLWGTVYSCGGTLTGAVYANNIWFGDAGKMLTNDPRVTFLTFKNRPGVYDTQALGPDFTMYRGYRQGAYSWATDAASSSLPMQLDIRKFRYGEDGIENSGDTEAVCSTETGPDGKKYDRCEREISVNRCFYGTSTKVPSYTNTTGGLETCGGDPTKIILLIPAVDPGTAQYWSTARAEVPAQSGVTARPPASESPVDGEAPIITVTLDSNTDTVNVDFIHKLFHDESLVNEPTDSHQPFLSDESDLCTNWNAAVEGAGSGDVSPPSGTFCQKDHAGQGKSGTEVSTGTVTVSDVQPGETKIVCSTITYDPKYIDIVPEMGNSFVGEVLGYKVEKDKDHGGETWQSKACVRIVRSEKESDAKFWSKSKVTINASAPDISGYELESQESRDYNGSTARISISTDYDQVPIKIEHFIYYDDYLWNPDVWSEPHVEDEQTFYDACTPFTVETFQEYEGGATERISVTDGEFCTGISGANSGKIASSHDWVIDLTTTSGPGKTVAIYEKISFEPDWHLANTDIHDWDCCDPDDDDCDPVEDCHGTWDHEITSHGGSASTTAGADALNPILSKGVTSNDSGHLYAGETGGQIHWHNMTAESLPTRRLESYEGAVYVVSDEQQYGSNITAGNIGDLKVIRDSRFRDPGASDSAICSFFRGSHSIYNGGNVGGLNQIVSCDIFDGFEEDGLDQDITTHTTSKHSSIIAPDEVGYKYCNSFGFMYEYWYHYAVDDVTDDWVHEGEKDYWEIFDSTCRTVVKKPSAALWNGSLMTNGSVMTSLAPRYNNASSLFSEAAGGQAQTLYGSWSEYLAVLGGSTGSFSSGAALGTGAGGLTAFSSDISKLTIANQNGIGNSGITNNSTYRTRLRTYLEDPCQQYLNGNRAQPSWGTCYSDIPANTTNTNVMIINGDYTLTHNVTSAPAGPYANLYQIPRNVIFVHGNLNISSNVTQIDAWLIVDGKINSCSDFNESTTADTTHRSGSACTNQLVFNGPVMASGIELRRSYGADLIKGNSRYTVGEVFNFRADDYLWAYAQAGRYASSYTEAYSRELAPRY